MQGGKQTEKDGGQYRYEQSKAEDSHVWMQIELNGSGAIRNPAHHAQKQRVCPKCQHNSNDSAGNGQEQALGQKLAHQPITVRANSEAQDKFFLPRLSASQEQVGNVCAGNQQDEADKSHQEFQRLTEVTLKCGSPASSRLNLQALEDNVHGGICLSVGNSRLAPTDNLKPHVLVQNAFR